LVFGGLVSCAVTIARAGSMVGDIRHNFHLVC
jgi:hypothetical protein